MKKVFIVVLMACTHMFISAQIQLGGEGSPIFIYEGKAGIGISNPSEKLHINGNMQLDLPVKYASSKSFLIFGDGNDHVIQGQAWTGSSNSNVKTRIRFTQQGLEFQVPQTFSGLESEITFNTGIFLSTGYYGSAKGNVGIGNTAPKAKLDVSGDIRATEIRVEAQTADFVFADDYSLKSLDEVKTFIDENKHLPDIPSAAQMETDGVNLAEMNKLLLQKIEELTLYVILLEKKNAHIDAQLRNVDALEKEMLQIKSLLTQLEIKK